AGSDPVNLVVATDANGTPSQIVVNGVTTTFSTYQLSSDPTFVAATRSAISASALAVRDTPSLGAVIDKPLDEGPPAPGRTWVQPVGVVAQPQPYAPPVGVGSGLDIKIKNTGDLYGTKTVLNGSYANGKVPLTIYNNYVRWIWIYVQYLG